MGTAAAHDTEDSLSEMNNIGIELLIIRSISTPGLDCILAYRMFFGEVILKRSPPYATIRSRQSVMVGV